MRKFNRSPLFWLILGVLWSLTVLFLSLEKTLASLWPLLIPGALALSCYAISFLLLLARNTKLHS